MTTVRRVYTDEIGCDATLDAPSGWYVESNTTSASQRSCERLPVYCSARGITAHSISAAHRQYLPRRLAYKCGNSYSSAPCENAKKIVVNALWLGEAAFNAARKCKPKAVVEAAAFAAILPFALNK